MRQKRYIPIPKGPLTPYEKGVLIGKSLATNEDRLASQWTPENVCFACGHSRGDHIGQPRIKGGSFISDRSWTKLPMGTCVFRPGTCVCTSFVEPSDTEIDCANRKIG